MWGDIFKQHQGQQQQEKVKNLVVRVAVITFRREDYGTTAFMVFPGRRIP